MVVSGKRCPYCGSELDLVTFLDVSEGELIQEIFFIECSRCGMILGAKGRSPVRGLLECVSCRNQFRVVGEKNSDVIVKMWEEVSLLW